jgi:hypothetical protein
VDRIELLVEETNEGNGSLVEQRKNGTVEFATSQGPSERDKCK